MTKQIALIVVTVALTILTSGCVSHTSETTITESFTCDTGICRTTRTIHN